MRGLAAKDPSLKERQPFKAALDGDADYFQQEEHLIEGHGKPGLHGGEHEA